MVLSVKPKFYDQEQYLFQDIVAERIPLGGRWAQSLINNHKKSNFKSTVLWIEMKFDRNIENLSINSSKTIMRRGLLGAAKIYF